MINYSAGGETYSQTVFDALVAARDAGVLCVASAGNDEVDNDVTPHYPASYDLENVISVASTDHTDNLSRFSNWGATSVDLGAPGTGILSTMPPYAAAFFEDFEAVTMPDIGDQFTLEGPVNHWGTIESINGSIAARGDWEHSYPYRPNVDGWIVTSPIDTTDLRGPSFYFEGRFEMEDDVDALTVELWDEASWTQIMRVSSSEIGEYYLSTKRFDLESFRDPATRVRFGWQTNADGNDYYGAEIDDVLIRHIGSDYTGEAAYGIKNGTSMAAPHVTGAAALLLADRPDMCLTELRNRLVLAGDPLPALNGITASGMRLNVHRALTASSGLAVLTPNGGEHWVLGTTHGFAWSVFECNPPDTVDIYLLKGSDIHSQLASNAPNTGVFVWSIPEDLPEGTDYRIRVDNGTVVDESDADFTIWSPFWYVDDDASEGGNGLTWSSSFKYLQDALAVATAGDTIYVAGGTYRPDVDESGIVVPGDRESTFQQIGGVRLFGGFAGLANPGDPHLRDIGQYETILSGDLNGDDGPHHVEEFAACFSGGGLLPQPECNAFDYDVDGDVDGADLYAFLIANHYGDNSYHVVTATVGEAVPELDGFTIVAGCADDEANWNNSLGGGLYGPRATSQNMRNCTFRGNAAREGSAMYTYLDSTLIVTDCVFNGNAAVLRGGGITCATRVSGTITGCSFSGNAANSGGGMAHYSSDTIFRACTFRGNRALNGGGMNMRLANPSLENCVFHGNSATGSNNGWGGGLYIEQGNPRLSNCTFNGNTADSTGGGICNSENANPTITNCIFWGDSPNELYNLPDSNPAVTYSDVQEGTGQPWFGTGCIDADPLFIDADGPDGVLGNEDDDLRLASGSQCIDSGNNTAATAATDLVNNPRIMDGDGDGIPTVDMGVYEYIFDCNDNGYPDVCDTDCTVLDGACDLPGCGASSDCNANAIPDECDLAGQTSEDCNGNVVPDECDVVGDTSDDCNANIIPDECDVASGTSQDCNTNIVPDECEPDCNNTGQPDDCDIAAGTSEDLDTNGIPDECECAIIAEPVQTPDGEAGYAKSRYISSVPGNPGEYTALRVTLSDLPAPFDIHNGTTMWVGEPIAEVSENAGKIDPAEAPGYGTFWSVRLSCDPPIYRDDWSTKSPLHVYSDAIVPGATYEVQAIHETCDVVGEPNYSAPLVVTTSRWGDLVGHCAVIPCSPPDGSVGIPTDVTACLDKFKNLVGAVTKSRADVEPNLP
ncbi:MAG: S8 family serine peptidase, partial [Phycisphaerales bacterium]